MTYCWTFSIRNWSVPVPGLHNQSRVRRRRVFYEVPWPLLFNACTRLVIGSEKSHAGGTGHSGLEENLYGGQNGRRKELLRRDEPGNDEGQRSLPSRSAGLMNLLGHSCGAVPDCAILRTDRLR